MLREETRDPAAISGIVTVAPLDATDASQLLPASLSGELFGFVIVPNGPASSRIVKLMRRACSQADPHPKTVEEPRTSPSAPLRRPASIRPAAAPAQPYPDAGDWAPVEGIRTLDLFHAIHRDINHLRTFWRKTKDLAFADLDANGRQCAPR